MYADKPKRCCYMYVTDHNCSKSNPIIFLFKKEYNKLRPGRNFNFRGHNHILSVIETIFHMHLKKHIWTFLKRSHSLWYQSNIKHASIKINNSFASASSVHFATENAWSIVGGLLYIFVNIYRCHNIKVIDHFMTSYASASNILNAKWQIDRPIKLQRIHNSLILFLKSVVKQENIYTLSKDTLDPFCSLTFTRYLWMHVPQGSSHVHLKVWNISKTLRLKQPSSFLGFNTPLKIKKVYGDFAFQ